MAVTVSLVFVVGSAGPLVQLEDHPSELLDWLVSIAGLIVVGPLSVAYHLPRPDRTSDQSAQSHRLA